MKIQLFSEIIEPNGKTIKDNNLEVPHKIPVGTLVEVHLDNSFGNGGSIVGVARLWVAEHTRDCDGTPLYTLVENLWAYQYDNWINDLVRRAIARDYNGYSEGSLKIMEEQ